MRKVVKFGGTSLSDATQIRKAINIIHSDPDRRIVVVSAPGKRHGSDRKVTDLLLSLYENLKSPRGKSGAERLFSQISVRFLEIFSQLRLRINFRHELNSIRTVLFSRRPCVTQDYVVSRGEYLMGIIMAAALDYEFVDAADVIRFDHNGNYDEVATDALLESRLKGSKPVVVPGFYGLLPNGLTKTFARGGSDITGSILARSLKADLYENWTDVSGMRMADPRIVSGPRVVSVLSYREMRELAYMGAGVFQEEAVFPVQKVGIPINIRNTNAPQDPGTMIVRDAGERKPGTIVGIAGRTGFSVIALEKALMNQQVGFVERVLCVLRKHGVSFEHMPSGIDTLSIIVETVQLAPKVKEVREGIEKAVSPDSLEVSPGMAMICTVGEAMSHTPGVAAKLFGTLAAANVNIRMINQGSSETNIIVGVSEGDCDKAINAIYRAFVG